MMDDALFLSEIVGGRWRPGIGDPTFMGWLTVAAYLVAAVGCVRASFREPTPEGQSRRKPSSFWFILSALLVGLGVNKQLDLQSWLTEIGRDFFKGSGIYQERRFYQVVFIGLIAVVCLILAGWFLWASRRSIRQRWMALVGLAFLLGFVSIRAASFHHVDLLLASTLGGLKWNGILELSGITAVAVSAFRISPKRPPGGPVATSRKGDNMVYSYDRTK